jgi:hypothetical protein
MAPWLNCGKYSEIIADWSIMFATLPASVVPVGENFGEPAHFPVRRFERPTKAKKKQAGQVARPA